MMKKVFLVFFAGIMLSSCAENPKNNQETATATKSDTQNNAVPSNSSKNLEASLEQLGGLLNMGKENEGEASPEVDALKKLLEMAGSSKNGNTNSYQEMITSEGILNMLEANGVSRSEMEQLLNNPDSLKLLAQEAIAKREELKDEEEEIALATRSHYGKAKAYRFFGRH